MSEERWQSSRTSSCKRSGNKGNASCEPDATRSLLGNALLPFAKRFMLGTRALLYAVSIGKEFNMIALLAGFKRHSLDLHQGFGFSGKASQQVKVSIVVDNKTDKTGRVSYEIAEGNKVGVDAVKRRCEYS